MLDEWRAAPIVLVEDDPHDRYFVERALEQSRILNPVVALASGNDARRHLHGDRKSAPALLILDLYLPEGETGLELLRWIRAQAEPLGSTPAMMLTGSEHPEHRTASQLLRAAFLHKPVTETQLAHAVQALGFVILTTAGSGGPGCRIIERR